MRIITLALGALLGATLPAAAQKPQRPNVLFIISDDLCTALSGFGHPQCKTPNLDRLAERGVRFERTYCQFPVCGPARAALLCGLYPRALGATGNGKSRFRPRHPDLVTLPQLFRQRGYYTARVSKIFHMGIPGEILAGTAKFDDPLSWDEVINIKAAEQFTPGEREDLCPKVKHQGVDFVKVEADGDDLVLADGQAARAAIGLLRTHRKEPFFLALGLVRPHVPLVAPRRCFEPYPPERMQLPAVPPGDLQDVPLAARSQTNARKYGMSAEQQHKVLGAYYAAVSFMDAQAGKVLDELERLDLAKSTIVVFTSDHGYNLGQHTCWQKLSLWEDTTRVPLIIAVPWLKAHGASCQRILEHIDLYPTLAGLCGLEPPPELHGRSFEALVADPTSAAWSEKAAYTISIRGGESLRTARWRYNLWREGAAGEELYDHRSDPGEFTNLAADPAHEKIRAELRRRLERARARSQRIGG